MFISVTEIKFSSDFSQSVSSCLVSILKHLFKEKNRDGMCYLMFNFETVALFVCP